MILVIGGIFFSCVLPNEARDKYNKGTTALNEARYEEASTILLEARDEAGTDAAVRIDSAYNLALTHARLAKSFEQEDPQKAVNSYSESASWFRDVVQRNPEDQEARYNLEVVLKRIQLLADRLNAGTNSLESRLDRLLEDTRMLRDQVRVLADTIANGTAPSMLESEFAQLAVQVRSTQADASTIIQLSGAERGNIENKSDEEKTPQDSMRVAQLTALESYLEKGRDEIADARRVLRNEDVEKSRTRLEDSVRSIFRAREQLQDPLAVLQSISQEEGQLLQQTSILMQSKNTFVMDPNQKIPQLPSWFDGDFLSDEQDNIHARTDEMAQRFAASAAQDPSEESTEEQQEFLALMKDALPPLLSSVAAMKEAKIAVEDAILISQAAANSIPAPRL